jgi:hypothetical protein
MRRRRWRWVGVGLVVAFGIFFALDVVTVQYLESRGAAELARAMSAEDAEIDLGGFPFVPRFLGGRLTGVSVQVRGASASGGLRVRSVEARMAGVSFRPGEMFALARSSYATTSEVTATEPIVILELGEGDLNDFIRRAVPAVGDVQVKGSGIEVRFLKDGVDPADAVRPSDDNLTKPARFLPTESDRKLRLILTSASQIPSHNRAEAERIEGLIDLPRFPEGLEPEVSMRDGVIQVEAQGAEGVKVTKRIGNASEPEPTAQP